jgi:hypothetical protein
MGRRIDMRDGQIISDSAEKAPPLPTPASGGSSDDEGIQP